MPMGEEMGGQVISTAANLSAKSIEAILKIFDRIFQLLRERSSAQYKNEKLKLSEHKDKVKAAKLLDKYSNMIGYVEYEKLKQAGVPLTAVNVHCTEAQLKRICDMAQRQGVLVSALEDASNELGGEKTYMLCLKKEDASRIADIVDTVRMAEKIDKIQEKIDEELAKGDGTLESLPPERQEFVRCLQKEIATIRGDRAVLDNENIMRDAIDNAMGAPEAEKMDFDTCMNRLTGKHIDKDTTFYVVDAINPDNYIKVHAEDDVYQGSHYIKSEYEVFNGNEKVFECNDGRFDGRPQNYWQSLVGQMKEKGNFSDEAVKFYSVEDMERYRAGFKREQENEIIPVQEAVEKHDYEKACALLESKIKENGYEFDKKTGKAIKDGVLLEANDCYNKELKLEVPEKVLRCEAYMSALQIVRYQQLAQLEAELSIAKADLFNTPAGSIEHAEMESKVNILSGKIDTIQRESANTTQCLQKVNALQCADATEQKIFIERWAEQYIDRPMDVSPDISNGMSMNDWKAEIADEKTQRGIDNPNHDEKIGQIEYYDRNGNVTECIEFTNPMRMKEMLDFEGGKDGANFKATLYVDSKGDTLVEAIDRDSISKAARGHIEFKPNVPNLNIDHDR